MAINRNGEFFSKGFQSRRQPIDLRIEEDEEEEDSPEGASAILVAVVGECLL